MDINEIRLTPDEQFETLNKYWLDNTITRNNYGYHIVLANAATDKAIRMILDMLAEETKYARLEDIFDTLFCFKQSLKKLLEVT